MVKKRVIVEMRVPKVPESRFAAAAIEITSQIDMPGFKLASDETIVLVRGEIEADSFE